MSTKVNVRKAGKTTTTGAIKAGAKDAGNIFKGAAKTVARGAKALGPKPINIGQAHNKKKK